MINKIKYLLSKIMEISIPSYLKDTHLYNLNTKIVSKGQSYLEFDDSIFHLQGGGQPNDKGCIIYKQHKYDILGGNLQRETGKLMYKFQPQVCENLQVGDQIQMQIDQQTRELHAKIHSAGHLLDLAVQRLKYQWSPGKGYHFADGPYVEYKGIFDANNAQKMVNDLNIELTHILTQKIKTTKEVYSYQQAVTKKLIDQSFKVSFVRLIKFDTNGCPCGGTHIHDTDEIKKITVSKLVKKKQNVRVMYKVE